MTIDTQAEIAYLNYYRLFEALGEYYYDEKHPDDMFNMGVLNMYENLSRKEQLKVLERARG